MHDDWLQPSPSSILVDNEDDLAPYPQHSVTIQPLPIPVRAFGFTREWQQPAREYKLMTPGLIVCSILCGCLGYSAMLCLPCICLLLTHIASKMVIMGNNLTQMAINN